MNFARSFGGQFVSHDFVSIALDGVCTVTVASVADALVAIGQARRLKDGRYAA